jgi:SAM-dependent methyltransferase
LFAGASLRESRCPACASSRRNRDLVRVLLRACLPRAGEDRRRDASLAARLDDMRALRVYELQAKGAIHDILRALPGYVCSEYYPDIPSGQRNERGILCQDAARLAFADDSFDLVISQDVLEHMEDPWKGFAEIQRVLRPGGMHIFTVPLHEGRKTRPRTRRGDAGELVPLLPPVRHKDPLNSEGALVYWDYGDDLPELLAARGIPARVALSAAFYAPEALCRVDDDNSAAACRQACAAGDHVSFFLYNSVVFLAEKP